MILSPSISECPLQLAQLLKFHNCGIVMWIHKSEDVNIPLSVIEPTISSQSVAHYVRNWICSNTNVQGEDFIS